MRALISVHVADETDEEVVRSLSAQSGKSIDQKRHQRAAGADLFQRVQGRDDSVQSRAFGSVLGLGGVLGQRFQLAGNGGANLLDLMLPGIALADGLEKLAAARQSFHGLGEGFAIGVRSTVADQSM